MSTPNAERMQRIERCLRDALQPAYLALRDDSHLHAGHAGARDGRGHFALTVVSPAFAGLAPLARHRRVYDALAALMQTDIHALQIRALTPDEHTD